MSRIAAKLRWKCSMGGIVSEQPRHPLVGRVADGGQLCLELPGKRGLAGPQEAVHQMYGGHVELDV
jgi:hypothetical protein